jgi:hypothetical protein
MKIMTDTRTNARLRQITDILSMMTQPRGLGGFNSGHTHIIDRWDAIHCVPGTIHFDAWNSNYPDLIGHGLGQGEALRDLLKQIAARTDAATAKEVLSAFYHDVCEALRGLSSWGAWSAAEIAEFDRRFPD